MRWIKDFNKIKRKIGKAISRILSLGNHSSRDPVTKILKRSLRGRCAENNHAPCLASDRVYSTLHSCKCGGLPKPAFSACPTRLKVKRSIFCYTFRSLAAPSLSLVSSPAKSRLSSLCLCFKAQQTAIACLPENLV